MSFRQIGDGDVVPGNIEGSRVMNLNSVVVTGGAIRCEFVHDTCVVHLAIRDGERILVSRLHHAPDVLLD